MTGRFRPVRSVRARLRPRRAWASTVRTAAAHARWWRERREWLGRAPAGPLAGALPAAGLLAATVLAGLSFGPAFGGFFAGSVAGPVLAVAGVGFALYAAALRWPAFERWRPGVTVAAGLLAAVETTLRATTRHGLPTGASVRALYDGARHSWRLTLASTLPARPEAALVVFVPLLVLVAAVIGLQLLSRTRTRLVALVPSLVLAGLAQAFRPLSGAEATLAAVIYGVAAAAVLTTRNRLAGRSAALVAIAAAPVLAGCVIAGAAVDPAARAAYSLQEDTAPVPAPTAVSDPLDEIAYRLEHPRTPLFTVDGRAGADRWPLAVLTDFDGTNWRADPRFRYVGGRLDTDPVPSSHEHRAQIRIGDLPGPWLPSQRGLRTVSGPAGDTVVVDEDTGTLLDATATPGARYDLTWATPDVTARQLIDSPLASGSPASSGPVPAPIVHLAHSAVDDAAPSFRTALVLERYLREHYKLAVGDRLPAGHGWPQIERFLGLGETAVGPPGGTSEQFAAAYVVLARVLGIPTRLVVGFRQPAPAAGGRSVIRNGDVLAWPEVAVRGIGWVPLDPSGATRSTSAGHGQDTLPRATAQARSLVPPPSTGRPHHQPKQPAPQPPPPAPDGSTVDGWSAAGVGGLGVAAFGLCWLIGVPVAKELRNGSRGRQVGNAAVVAAWLETRDRLRDHGVPVRPGMTVRDVAAASRGLVGHGAVGHGAEHALDRLGTLVNVALWSGAAVSGPAIEEAWRACDTVRHSLAARSRLERFVALVRLRGLRPVR